MSYIIMIGYDIYDRFTMEHFPLRQSMILTTSFFCSRQYVKAWPTKSELRCVYYGRNKARIFNGAIDSANLKKFTLNQLHLLAK
jgi:hypothetical protein